jgi:hypothetical protein
MGNRKEARLAARLNGGEEKEYLFETEDDADNYFLGCSAAMTVIRFETVVLSCDTLLNYLFSSFLFILYSVLPR